MPNIGSLNVTHNFAGNAFNYVIMQLVKSTSPLAEIERVVYPAPYSQETYLFENLQPVWHLIRFWSSTDGVTLDTEVLTIAGNARSGALYPISTYEYVVGRGDSEPGVWADPVQDDIGIRDTRLLNAYYWVEERGTGSLLTTEIVDRSDDGGGFDFDVPGKVMNDGGVYIVRAIQRVDVAGDSGDSGDIDAGDVYILSDDEDYDSSTHNGKKIIADFSTTVGQLTIPNLALVPDGGFKLLTHTGLQRNVIIQLDAGDTVNFRKEAVNKIVLGEGEDIEILFLDGVMYVTDHNTNHFQLGKRFWGDIRDGINTLLQDGTTYNQADYPRVVDMLDSLPAGAVVNYTTWNTSQVLDGVTRYPYKGFFARDDGAGTFRVPDIRTQTFKALSATDGSINAGRYENQEMLAHNHNLRGGFIYGGYDGGGNQFWRIRNLTDPYSTDEVIEENGGSDNIVNNIGLYPLICI